ncbi:MAG: hypothetical protein DRR16_07285 [Candidatus Parabeggiatoa sp. nov. 3]|nr:MAG: hypothetical protein DRR00_10415 [Gammaproteobacteria bacterium]RKZ65108.1 MAG: hypothetical protein DRQ99_13610 [Gammaproteobacteria bacterium]RKZ87423.1 MAG: hypothetical protein DRR16_07285 [Gammaproteobacteria bacterium]
MMTEQEESQSQQDNEKQEDEKLVDNAEKEPEIPGEKESIDKSTAPQISVRPKVESDSIETISTIGSIYNSTIQIGQSTENSKDEPTFKDPTRSFPSKPAGLPAFNSAKEEIEAYFKELKNKRVLLVECFDENILRAATYELVNIAEEHYEKRLLAFEGRELEQTDLHLGILVNEKIGSGEKLIVVISLKSKRFLDSMFVEESLYAQSIKEQLEKNDIMLVCFANSSFLQENIVGEKGSNFHFPKWDIPFLPYLLKAHFKDEAKSVEEQILRQRNYGLWDENNSDREFYGLISGYLRNGIGQFKEEVEKRSRYTKGQNVQDFLFKEIRTVGPKELIQDDDLVKNTVLYVATFFPELSPRDFDYVISLLLNGKKTEVTVESSQVKTKKGRVIGTEYISTKKEEKDCIEIWEKDHDNIMAASHLQVIRSDSGSQIVDFSLPYLRGELKKYLEQKSLYINHFERIRESGLLFNFNVSQQIIENVINLAAEMAISDSSHYGGNWLMDIIIGLKQHLNIQLKIDPNVDPRDVNPDKVFELINQELKTREQEVRAIIIRLSKLIREMLNYTQLQEMVKNFLDNLIRKQDYATVLMIVLGIVKQLRFASQFDGMYWIKQLLDRGDQKAKNEVYNTLLEQAKKSGLRVYELLDTLKTWLPDRGLEHEKYSLSNEYALKLIIDYAMTAINNFKAVDYGVWPSKYPLFANLNDDNELAQIDLLVSWVFHPGMEYALKHLGEKTYHQLSNQLSQFKKALLEDNSIDNANNLKVIKDLKVFNIILADLVEMWFKMLHGFDTKNTHPEVLSISERLLQQVVLNSDRSQRTFFLRRWWLRQGLFTNEIRKISLAERAKRQRFINERKVILELHQKFKALAR